MMKKNIIISLSALVLLGAFGASLTTKQTSVQPTKVVTADTKDTVVEQQLSVDDEVSQISNTTIREFVQYFRATGDNPDEFCLFEDLSDDKRIVVIDDGTTPADKAPVIGYSADDAESTVVGSLTTEEGTITFDTSDPSQSATIAEIKAAVAQYQ